MAWARFLCFYFISGFQKQRFGIFPAAVSQCLRHKTCWGSAFSHALPKHLQAIVSQWLGHKTCWGSAFFACAPQAPSGYSFAMAWATKPAEALLFRMRSPSTFFLGFALFLVGSKSNVSAFFWLRFRMAWARFLCFYSGFQKQRFGIFQAAVSQWLRHKTCWGSAFSRALPKHLFLGFCLVFAYF